MRRTALLIAALLLTGAAPAAAQDARVLMLGNSYTDSNQLDQLVAGVLAAAVPAWSAVDGRRLTQGGMTLADHAALADGTSGDTAWRQALVTGPEAGTWNWVVLQDQSQIPGFPHTEPSWTASRDGAVTLALLAGLRVLAARRRGTTA